MKNIFLGNFRYGNVDGLLLLDCLVVLGDDCDLVFLVFCLVFV